MKKNLYIICFLILLSIKCLPLDKIDTLIKSFPEIDVISSRISNNPVSSFFPIFMLDSCIINNKSTWQISEILNISPGLFIKDYGGLGGMKTLSMRGTTTSQTLIMLDGMKLNSIQNGIVDLSILPNSFIDGIEIQRSGSSAIYGSNSIGGSINIISSFYDIKDFKLRTNFNYASYSDILTNLTMSFPIGVVGIQTSTEIISSSGKYPFVINQYGKEEEHIRENADFTNFITTIAGNIKRIDWQANSRLLLRWTNRGVPSAVVQGKIEDKYARLKEKEIISINSFKKQFSSEQGLSFGLNMKYNELKYDDSSLLAQKENNYYNSEVNLNANYGLMLFGISSNIFLEGNYYTLAGDNIKSLNSENMVDRINLSTSLILNAPIEIDEWLFRFMAGSRFDYYSDWNSFGSFSTGINIENSNFPMSFRGIVSSNYRMPSFNELYYFNYGSTSLKPEESVSINIGINGSFFSTLKFEIDGFYINTINQIVSVPKSPIIWKAENIGKVITRGIEITSGLILFDSLLNISLNYTLQKASDESENSLTKGKIIPYIPQEMLKVYSLIQLEKFSFGISADYTGFRFSLPDNSKNSLLPEFLILDLNSSYIVNLWQSKINLSFSIKNLLNTRYSIIMNYPMPGITIRCGIGLEI